MGSLGYGASPPADKAWQLGKTAATIRFVDDAERALAGGTEMEEREKHVLRTLMQALKDGDAVLQDPETVDDWLERLRDHYP